MHLDGIGDVAEIGDDGATDALRADDVADGVNGVVGDRETANVEVADREAGAGLEGLTGRGDTLPVDSGFGQMGEVDGLLVLAGEDAEAGDVVAVFMGDDNCVEVGGVFADGEQPGFHFTAAEPDIDDDAGAVRADEDGVAGTG